jgi:phosphopantothenoylcysteine decarboxylase/phosphopantothenate--cysteine ligase
MNPLNPHTLSLPKALVTLIAGATTLPTPAGAKRIDVESAQDMHDAVLAATN